MRISEIVILERQKESKFMGWTIRIVPGKGGIAFKSKDEYVKSESPDENTALQELQTQIRDHHQENSKAANPNIQSADVTKTTGTFNTAFTRVFEIVPEKVRVHSDDGPTVIDFLINPEKSELYPEFNQLKSRNFGKGEPVYQTSITPKQVIAFGLEFAGIYGMDETHSPDPDLKRFTLTPLPIDYLEGMENRKTFPFPTFSIPTWTTAGIAEDRRDDLEYRDEKDRVTVYLTGRESETQTKINKIDAKLAEKAKALARERKDATEAQKARFKELFDAADEAKTLVVETVSFSQTLSRKSEVEKSNIDYAGLMDELRKLKPELNTQLDALLEKFTEIKQVEVPQKLLAPQKLPLKENFIRKVVQTVMKFVGKFKQWSRSYRSRLDNLKKRAPSELTEESVLSSWIEDLEYHPSADGDQEGNVEMRLGNGKTYTVYSVPFGEFQDWLGSDSKGRFWHSNIRGTYSVT